MSFRDWQDDGAPTVHVLWERNPVARKPYKCDCCGREIKPGTRYHSTGYTVDGKFEHQRTHDGRGLCIDALYDDPEERRLAEEDEARGPGLRGVP